MEIDYSLAAPSEMIRKYCRAVADAHPHTVSLHTLGYSLAGQPIEYLRIGQCGDLHLFVGAHHGSEHITANLLVKFISDCAGALERNGRLAGFDAGYIFSKRSVFIVPVINPDGTDIEQGAFSPRHILFRRLVSMNPAGMDFTHWQANARGVDLNHNYDAGFWECKKLEQASGIYSGAPTRFGGHYPESEPETRALCALTRLLAPKLRTAVALHTQGEEIYYDFSGNAPEGSEMLAECFSRVSGYKVSHPEGIASYGGFKDWVIKEFGIPAFTIECGSGKNPLPPDDFFKIYEKVLPILLTAAAFR